MIHPLESDMPQLVQTKCAICGTTDNAQEMYAANFDLDAFSPEVFSARRVPDRLHYRMVRCSTCGLVRSDPAGDVDLLLRLYSQSKMTYGEDLSTLIATYGGALKKLEALGVQKGSLLEIGCGNGFFLEEALRQGYASVYGVEPSQSAVEQAQPAIRRNIHRGMMQPGLFAEDSFDLVCMFQVLDHISQPDALARECGRILKPGGLVLCWNHNVEAFSAWLLRERNPMIDIEHTYLYSPKTISRLFQASGFEIITAGAVWNIIRLDRLARMMPLPARGKAMLLGMLERTSLGRMALKLPLGNLCMVARKPESPLRTI